MLDTVGSAPSYTIVHYIQCIQCIQHTLDMTREAFSASRVFRDRSDVCYLATAADFDDDPFGVGANRYVSWLPTARMNTAFSRSKMLVLSHLTRM